MSFQPQIPLAGHRRLAASSSAPRRRQQAAFEKGPELAARHRLLRREHRHGSPPPPTSSPTAGCSRSRSAPSGSRARSTRRPSSARCSRRAPTDRRLRQPPDRAGASRSSPTAFGFGNPGGARTGDAGFAARIVAAYKTRAFEAAVGETNNDMRLAMNFRREIVELAKGAEGGSWFTIIGSKPLRAGDREGLRPAEGVRQDRRRPPARHPARQDRARCSAPTTSPPSRTPRMSRR